MDAVLILTPPRTHAQLAVASAKAGKHVLLEKPVNITLEQARAIVAAVEREGRKLGIVFQYRFRPGTIALRKLLREGALGELLSVSCAVRWWRPAEYYAQPGRGMRARDGGGVLLTQSIHRSTSCSIWPARCGASARSAAPARCAASTPKTSPALPSSTATVRWA